MHTGTNPTPTKPPFLTEPQHKALVSIRDLIRDFGVSPTYEELGERLGGITKNAAKHFVQVLARDGYLKLAKRRDRFIELTHNGRIAANKPANHRNG